MTPLDPTLGLDRHQRTALCDASYGPLALIGGLYRRQTLQPAFEHATATIDRLVARKLLDRTGDIVAITWAGKRAANAIRQRRQAIAAWEGSRAISAGVRRSLERAHG